MYTRTHTHTRTLYIARTHARTHARTRTHARYISHRRYISHIHARCIYMQKQQVPQSNAPVKSESECCTHVYTQYNGVKVLDHASTRSLMEAWVAASLGIAFLRLDKTFSCVCVRVCMCLLYYDNHKITITVRYIL